MRAFVVGLALILAAPVARATPMFTGLGAWFAEGVSANGSVVVGERAIPAGSEAIRWTASGGIVGLGYLPGGDRSLAHAVSADGAVVVGESATTPGGGGDFRAYRWTAQGGMISLGSLAGDTFASDVSDDGSVVVGGTSEVSLPEAFRWTEGTGMVGLGMLPGGTESQADAVSADGSVVVGYSRSPSLFQAFLWTAENGMLALAPGATTDSFASDVSADGSVVVGEADNQAFRWTASSGMVGLGFLPGESASSAEAVSADGSIVVGQGQTGGFIWDPVHGMRSLPELLVKTYGLDLTGWSLDHVTGISADGLTIVGWGINPNGQEEGWIAILPEPSTGVLLTLGLAGLAGWHRRSV